MVVIRVALAPVKGSKGGLLVEMWSDPDHILAVWFALVVSVFGVVGTDPIGEGVQNEIFHPVFQPIFNVGVNLSQEVKWWLGVVFWL